MTKKRNLCMKTTLPQIAFKIGLTIFSITFLIISGSKSMAETPKPLFLDLRIKDLTFNNPKPDSFPIGPVGNIKFDSVLMSQGNIDLLNLKKEHINILDSKIFLKKNPSREQFTFFGRPRGPGGESQGIGLSILSQIAQFKMFLKKDSLLKDIKLASTKEFSFRLNPSCPQFKAPILELKSKDFDLIFNNLDLKCPFKGKMGSELTENVILKCLNRGILIPLTFSTPKKNAQHPESLCNNNLKNKPYLEGNRGPDPKAVDFYVHLRSKPKDKNPKNFEVEGKLKSANFTSKGFIEANAQDLSLKFFELDPKDHRSITKNMIITLPQGRIKCKKKPLKNIKFSPSSIVDDCLNSLDVGEIDHFFIKDNLSGTSFKIDSRHLKIDSKLNFDGKDICIADSKKAIGIHNIKVDCIKDENKNFLDLPQTILSCLKSGKITIDNVSNFDKGNIASCLKKSSSSSRFIPESEAPLSFRNELENFLSKPLFFNPFSHIWPKEESSKKTKFLSNLSISVKNNYIKLSGNLYISSVESKVSIEGNIDFNQKENLFILEMKKARLPLGIKSTRFTAWIIKSFMANEKVWVDKNKKIHIKL